MRPISVLTIIALLFSVAYSSSITQGGGGGTGTGSGVEVYAESFGAVGDGSTDDTAAIQAALNSVASGGVVRLKSKIYKTTAALVMANSFVTLAGAGSVDQIGGAGGTVISNTTTTGNIITATNGGGYCSLKNIQIKDMTLYRPTPATAGTGIKFQDACLFIMENVSSIGNWDHFWCNGCNSSIAEKTYGKWTSASASLRAGWNLDTTGSGTNASLYLRHPNFTATSAANGANTIGVYDHGNSTQDLFTNELEVASMDRGVLVLGGGAANQDGDIYFYDTVCESAVSCFDIQAFNQSNANLVIAGGHAYGEAGGWIGAKIDNSRGVILDGFQFLAVNTSSTGVKLQNFAAYNSILNSGFNSLGTGVLFNDGQAGNLVKGNTFKGNTTHFSALGGSIVNLISENIFGGTATTGMNFDATSGNNVAYPNVMLTGAITTPIANAATGNQFGFDALAGVPTVTATGCTGATLAAGSMNAAGKITGLPAGACSVVLNFQVTKAATGWTCAVSDQTTGNLFRQTANTSTTATLAGTSAAADVLAYQCTAY